MKVRRNQAALATAVVVAWGMLAPGAARGQVFSGQEGRLMDVNPLVGGSGINTQRPVQSYTAGAYSNYIVTGNVTGARSFRAFSPIRDSSSFFIDLPSSSLTNFRRDTIGVDDVRRNPATFYNPRPYYDPSQTVLDSGAISLGLNTPGGSIPSDPYRSVNPLSYSLSPQLVSPQLLGASTDDARIQSGLAEIGLLSQTLQRDGAASAFAPAPVTPQALNSGAMNQDLLQSPLFAANPNLRERQNFVSDPVAALRELREARPVSATGEIETRVDPRTEALVAQEAVGLGSLETEGDPWQAAMYNRQLEPVLPGAAALGPELQSPLDFSRYDVTWSSSPRVTPPGLIDSAPTDLLEATSAAQEYADLYRRRYQMLMRSRLIERTAEPEPEAPLARGGAAGEAGGEAGVEGAGATAVPQAARVPAGMAYLTELLGGPVSSLATSAATPVNEKLKVAERLVKAKQYYTAAGQCQIAEAYDPRNPLPVLARGHALFAAGEYLSASHCIQRGIGMFPGFENVRLDMKGIIPDAKLLDVRRADLEKRLGDNEDYELRFLLGYVDYYMGLEEFGLPQLERAAAAAPAGSVIARFPEMLAQRVELSEPVAAEAAETEEGAGAVEASKEEMSEAAADEEEKPASTIEEEAEMPFAEPTTERPKRVELPE